MNWHISWKMGRPIGYALSLLVLLFTHLHLATSELFHSTPAQSSPPPRISRAPLRVPIIKGHIPYKIPFNLLGNVGSPGSEPRDTTPPLTAVSAPPNYSPPPPPQPAHSREIIKSPPPPPKLSSANGPNNVQKGPAEYTRKPEGSAHTAVKVPSPDPRHNEVAPSSKNMKMGRFPLDELVSAIAEAAINGHIPFNKVDLRKPLQSQSLQIPVLLLRPEDLYRATGTKINFKLITAHPIRIPIFDEPPAPYKLPSIHSHHQRPPHHHAHSHSHNNHHNSGVNHFNANLGFGPMGPGPYGGGSGHREMRGLNFDRSKSFGPAPQNSFHGNTGNNNNNENYVLFNKNNAGFATKPAPNFNHQQSSSHFPASQPSTSTTHHTSPSTSQTPSTQVTQKPTTSGQTVSSAYQQQQHSKQNHFGNGNSNLEKSVKNSKLDVLKVIPAPKLSKSSDSYSNHIDSQSHGKQQRAFEDKRSHFESKPKPTFDEPKSTTASFNQHSTRQQQQQQHSRSNSGSYSGHSSGGSLSSSFSSSSGHFGGSNSNSNSGRSTSSGSSSSSYSGSSSSDDSSGRQRKVLKQDNVIRTLSSNYGDSSSSSGSSSSSASSSENPTGKRKRPVIRIRPEGPPIRINSPRAPIRLKSERPPVRMNPMVRKKEGEYEQYEDKQQQKQHQQQSRAEHENAESTNRGPNLKSNIIPERYLQDMPPYKSEGQQIKTVPFPKFTQDESGPSSAEETYENRGREHSSGGSRGSYENNNVNVNAAFSKSSHAKQQSRHQDFGSVFRKSTDEEGSYDSGNSGSERESHITRTSSGSLEDLEKSGYDKQLVKTLKNLMATTAKRHKLNFEEEEGGQKTTRKGKIPDKYLKESPLGDLGSDTEESNAETGAQFDDSINEETFKKHQTTQQPYQHYGSETTRTAEEPPENQNSHRFNTQLGQSYRVSGFDPNYEYLDNGSNQGETGSSRDSDTNDSSAEEAAAPEERNLGDLQTEVSEDVGPDGKKVKTYVMTGIYRKKVDEVLHNEAEEDYHQAESAPIPAEVLVARVFESSRSTTRDNSESKSSSSTAIATADVPSK